MKAELAETILKGVMQWEDPGTVATELQDIQIISEIKYDDYQQYTHGMRYIENLALWLRGFNTQEKRECAYKFIKENLIFISEEEMRQIVSVSFDIYMKPIILDLTKKYCQLNNITDINERKELWKYFRRKTLFLGLSDGSHMDYFRRQNAALSNEQVFIHYDFSNEKAIDMLNELNEDKDIASIKLKYNIKENETFNTFFLIDDFSASGKSYIRKEEQNWKGKIVKFFDRLDKVEYNKSGIEVHIILYVATQKAVEYIRKQISIYKQENSINEIITIDAIQIIEPYICDPDGIVFNLFKEDYEMHINNGEDTYVDKHFTKGDCQYPFLGFDKCSLPLILYHNTPNNSFPVLWHSWMNGHALFPRVTRHKES